MAFNMDVPVFLLKESAVDSPTRFTEVLELDHAATATSTRRDNTLRQLDNSHSCTLRTKLASEFLVAS